MQIIQKSDGLDERQIFKLTRGDCQKMKDCVGVQFDVAEYVLYTDTDKKTGEERELLILVTPEGESYGTNSATVIKTFLDMLDTFTLPISDIVITKKRNDRSGRDYCNIVLV